MYEINLSNQYLCLVFAVMHCLNRVMDGLMYKEIEPSNGV